MDEQTLEREIEALLAVEPAPDFRARVRQRIAEQPPLEAAPFAGRLAWLAMAAATAVAVIIAASVGRRDVPHVPELLAARPIEGVAFTADASISPRDLSRVPVQLDMPGMRIGRVAAPAPIIIDRSEVAAWQRLLRDINAGRVALEVAEATPQAPAAQNDEFVVPPVRIEPLISGFFEEGVHQ
jgi:hypothetical protein